MNTLIDGVLLTIQRFYTSVQDFLAAGAFYSSLCFLFVAFLSLHTIILNQPHACSLLSHQKAMASYSILIVASLNLRTYCRQDWGFNSI